MQPSPIAETSSPLFPSSRFFMLKISQESGIQETNFLLLNFYFLLRPCSLRFQRILVDREPIFHIGFKQSLVSFVHFLNCDYFDVRVDVVIGGNGVDDEIETAVVLFHLIGVARNDSFVGAEPERVFLLVRRRGEYDDMCSERVSKFYRHVAESAETNHA